MTHGCITVTLMWQSLSHDLILANQLLNKRTPTLTLSLSSTPNLSMLIHFQTKQYITRPNSHYEVSLKLRPVILKWWCTCIPVF